MTDDNSDSRTKNERKTGRVMPGTSASDPFTIRAALPTLEAAQRYDQYLKDHKRRLRQLERLAAGELTPSSESY